MSASACEGESEDIEIERMKLASGEYFGIAWGGSQVERFHVVAHRGTSDGDVVIIPGTGEEPCSVGPAAGYETQQPLNGGRFVIGAPSPARIALFDRVNEDGGARLGFSGVDCQRTDLEVDGVDASRVRTLLAPDLMQLQIAAPVEGGTLLFLDPWQDKEQVFAREVAGFVPYEDGMWLIEGGRAVRRELDGRVLARHGEEVRELLPLSDSGDLAYVDVRGMVLHQAGEDIELAQDGCRARAFSAFMPGALAYFSPCQERTLVVRERGTDGKDGMEHRYAPRIANLVQQSGRFFFTTDDDSGETPRTELWMVAANAPDEPLQLAVRERFTMDSLWSIAGGGRLLLLARMPDDSLSLWVVTANEKGDGATITVAAEGLTTVRTYQGALALVNSERKLELYDMRTLSLLFRDDDVAAVRFVFGSNDTALAYLADVDRSTGTGELNLHFMSGEHFALADDVREYREVWWPETGMVYAASGEEPGVYFTRVKVPCEKVSNSPWACGF